MGPERPSNLPRFLKFEPAKRLEYSHDLYVLLTEAVGPDVSVSVVLSVDDCVEHFLAGYTEGDEEEIRSAIAGAIKRYRFNFTAAALARVDALALQHLAPLVDLKSAKRPVHALKLEEARRLTSDPQASAPLLRSEAEKTGQAVEDLAAIVIMNAEQANAAIAEIESDRCAAKRSIREAKSRKKADSILADFEARYPPRS